ncbi:SMI1 / KNR4 family (SUKH-1) [Chitinophaga eiseniae]|uniref:SMI1 / KNR4 family (SUKH-1) n=1 Tax=Chitinophaga eiseniae TaxID=634771 RepID=A0A1T4TL71_9BACT|nr:SMI1/KNR4 family protein [Chitinophaga eiseniae]SKA41210.1 SMI1 / KNR4 family (SUKH-1) [Chitinophaga eiseniae]
MKNIVEQYLAGLQERLSEEDKAELTYASGATAAQLEKLQQTYPDCPASLLQLLAKIDGTYWREYGEHTVSVLILGSDIHRYPYYLKSVDQILEDDKYGLSIRDIYGEDADETPELVDTGIDSNINMNRWLCFSDCTNNGGTSKLYLDFNPAPGGASGQVVRFLHDPDNYRVIAGSFDEYLLKLMEHDYTFISSE